MQQSILLQRRSDEINEKEKNFTREVRKEARRLVEFEKDDDKPIKNAKVSKQPRVFNSSQNVTEKQFELEKDDNDQDDEGQSL